MSDIKDEFLKQMAEDVELDIRTAELRKKELILRERKVENEIDALNRSDQSIAITKESKLGRISDKDIARYKKDNTDYLHAAKNPIPFIHPIFDKVVPLFRNNLILIGAETGQGKSTCVSNIILTALRNGKRILVLTNEQNATDFYNTVSCYILGIPYTDHASFSPEIIQKFEDNIEFFGKSGRLTIIDDTFGGSTGVTTTIEGIQGIFENLIANREYYDLVILDYYQSVHLSSRNPKLTEWDVQRNLGNLLDTYKNVYPAPIVLMAQVKPQGEDENVPFKVRLEGVKAILNRATFSMEMVADKQNLKTEWLIEKSRFSSSQGSKIVTGYDRGRFVEYTEKFVKDVNDMKDARERKQMNKSIGLLDVNKDNKKDKKEGEDAKVQEETSGSGSTASDD